MLFVIAGCQAAPVIRPQNSMSAAQPVAPSTPTAEHPRPENQPVVTDNQPVRYAPLASRPFPIEPLGKPLISQLQSALVGEPSHAEPITVSLVGLRNLSGAQQEEFTVFRKRLAEVLTMLGREDNLRFTAEGTEPADYEMHGAAYLAYRAGFDVWEIYPRITVTGAAWTVWQTSQPIIVLRFARPNQPQIVSIPNGSASADQPPATAAVR